MLTLTSRRHLPGGPHESIRFAAELVLRKFTADLPPELFADRCRLGADLLSSDSFLYRSDRP